jgi:DNA-binding HxlR family transcriptional regulator
VPKRYGQACPVAKSLELVGDRWTLLLVRDMLPGPRRFQDLQHGLPGIPPNILSDRLKLMEEHALVTRRELGVVVGALAAWGSRHVHRRTALVHADCGHPVEIKYFCRRCAERVPGATVELRRKTASGKTAKRR